MKNKTFYLIYSMDCSFKHKINLKLDSNKDTGTEYKT